jgi:DNA polymerase
MTPVNSPSLENQLAAALAWWREAGVDRAYRDEAEGWLSEPSADTAAAPIVAARRPEQTPEAETPRVGGPREGWPRDLAAFAQWWLTEASLDEGGSFPRVVPRGVRGADLMVLVAQPQENDETQLLAGAHGAMLTAMFGAMGIEPSATYIAAALPRHTPLPDWTALTDAGLAELTAHHVALAKPKRLIAFGRSIWPLVGHDTAQSPDGLHIFNHEGVRVPTMSADGLDRLLRSATARAAFWRRWLDWTDGTGDG